MLYCMLFNSNCIALDTAQCTALFTILRRGDNRSVTELSFAHISTKIWAYSVVFNFFRKKIWQKNGPPKSLFENTKGNDFFYLFYMDQIAQKNLKKSYYIELYQKTPLGLNFGLWEVPYRKMQESESVCFCEFSGWGTSQSQKLNLKAVF